TLNCDMIVALHKWLKGDVQPLARKHLGAPIVSVNVMSSFSCRNAYGRAKTRLSEHGRVNALDLGAFLTAQGGTTHVVADWGPATREPATKVTAEQAEAVTRQAEAAAAARKPGTPAAPEARPSPPKTLQAGTQIGIPGLTLGTRSSDSTESFGWAPPSRL